MCLSKTMFCSRVHAVIFTEIAYTEEIKVCFMCKEIRVCLRNKSVFPVIGCYRERGGADNCSPAYHVHSTRGLDLPFCR